MDIATVVQESQNIFIQKGEVIKEFVIWLMNSLWELKEHKLAIYIYGIVTGGHLNKGVWKFYGKKAKDITESTKQVFN